MHSDDSAPKKSDHYTLTWNANSAVPFTAPAFLKETDHCVN